jgi:hypothetical protein
MMTTSVGGPPWASPADCPADSNFWGATCHFCAFQLDEQFLRRKFPLSLTVGNGGADVTREGKTHAPRTPGRPGDIRSQ